MKNEKLTIMAVDDDAADLEMLKWQCDRISDWKVSVLPFEDWESARPNLQKASFDLICLDYFMGEITALEILQEIRGTGDHRPIIIMSGQGSESLAAELTRNGADDYLVKGRITAEALRRSIWNVMERAQLRLENERLEKRLLQAQKMEAIGTLAGGIAHDFNNILFPIMGYADMSMQMLEEGHEVRRYIDNILKASCRARELVQQILDFSRQNEQKVGPVRMDQIAKEAIKLLRAAIPTSIEIQPQIDSGCRPAMGNANQIHQIIMNLCTNASHAMNQEDGVLEISLMEVTPARALLQLNQAAEGPYIRLTIRDNGCGMSREVQERMFDPFFTTKEIGKGTGMGLSAVHGIVSLYKGFIQVDSAVGKGTCVDVYLPVMIQEQEEKTMFQPLSAYGSNGNQEHVLLVDDEVQVVDLMRLILEKQGYSVTGFNSSVAALQFYREHSAAVDLVITDKGMPNMNGLKLAQEMLFLHPGKPIILCTGYDEILNTDAAREAGLRAVLSKPVPTWELLSIIRKVLDGRTEDSAIDETVLMSCSQISNT